VKDIREYHERTKHRLQKYAQGPGYLDWANQPNPFRTYEGAERIQLPLEDDDPQGPYDTLFGLQKAPARPWNLQNASTFLRLSLGLAAWKEYGASRWALRINPSSGNLHSEEAYIITGAVPGLAEGVYHYHSRAHALERRLHYDSQQYIQDHPEVAEAGVSKNIMPSQGYFWVGLSSIHWREEWKYGERAYRYCQLDIGHALLCLRFAAEAMGWRARLAPGASDGMISRILGLGNEEDYDGAETESPGAMVLVTTDGAAPENADEMFYTTAKILTLLQDANIARWSGKANVISARHGAHWPVIEEADQVAFKPSTDEEFAAPPPAAPLGPSGCAHTAAHIIKTRRSGQAYDGASSMSADKFNRILSALIPRPGMPPWDAIPWRATVHPVLFVHRVDGFAPGMYILVRGPGEEEELKAAMGEKYRWSRPPAAREGLPLYLLKEMDARGTAAMISCGQDMAGDGVFSLGMLARFEDRLATGQWWYRRLHWEAGAVGQALYMEAEAAGFRGTGIGCYYDDIFHSTVGLKGEAYACLYHFTIGVPVEDERLITLPPYGPGEDRDE